MSNKAAGAFPYNLNRSGYSEIYETFIEVHQPEQYIDVAFQWGSTPEGYDHWERLNDKWLEEIGKPAGWTHRHALSGKRLKIKKDYGVGCSCITENPERMAMFNPCRPQYYKTAICKRENLIEL